MNSSDPSGDVPETPLTRAIVKHQNILWGTLIVIYLFAYSGHWRVGRDSSLYRGLAHSLATGQGYSFGHFARLQIYPGLPFVLAGLEKLFGPEAAWPGILFVHALSITCLIFVYKLVRLRFPQWVAVMVTFCSALNGWYLELTNEIRDDLPFLCGMMIALYGWERLRIAMALDRTDESTPETVRPSLVRPLAYLIVGLALAAVMRPTFWILAIAWVMVCAWGLLVGPRRRFYAITLGILIVVWIAVAALDPRVRGFNPLGGGYERDAQRALGTVGANIAINLPLMLSKELAYGFFGQKWVPGMTQLMNVLAIAASLLLWRKNPLWTLLVLGTVAVTLIMGAVPRYYIMVLPLMMLSWVLLTCFVAQKVPHRWLEIAILAGLLMVCIPNLIRCVKVIGQQRGWDRGAEEPAKWQYVINMSEQVRALVAPGDKVIAPGASIMSYLSGRDVVMQREIIPLNKPEKNWPIHLAALRIKYAVFPSTEYNGAERRIRDLMDRGVIVPVERVAKVGDLALMKVEIRVPPEGQDWRKRAVATTRITVKTTVGGMTRPSAAQLAKKRRHLAAAKKAEAQRKAFVLARHERELRQAAAEAKAAARRAAAKARKARRAVTQPVTQPATQPTAATPYSPRHAAGYVDRTYLFDPGGFSGQSVASRNASICFRENFRVPVSIPGQPFFARSQLWRLASKPSQNGQVRHCSGRTLYTVQTRLNRGIVPRAPGILIC